MAFFIFCWPCIMEWFSLNDQCEVQFFSMYLFIFLTLHMFRAHRANHQERKIVSIQPLVAVGGHVVCRSEVHFQPAHNMATDTEWQLPKVVLTQFVSPDVEHDVLEICRELKIQINTYKRIERHVGHLTRIIQCDIKEKKTQLYLPIIFSPLTQHCKTST